MFRNPFRLRLRGMQIFMAIAHAMIIAGYAFPDKDIHSLVPYHAIHSPK